MEKKYHKINFNDCPTLEEALDKLKIYKRDNILACGDFNGVTLYSDTFTRESAYQQVTGKSKLEIDLAQLQALSEIVLEKQKQFEKQIPEQVTRFKEKGRKVLDECYWSEWDEVIPIRLKDLFRGKELDASLVIIKYLNSGSSLEAAKIVFEAQDLNPFTATLVLALVGNFCKRGESFFKYVMN